MQARKRGNEQYRQEKYSWRIPALFVAGVLSLGGANSVAAGPEAVGVFLAREGEVLQQVVVSEAASERTRKAARDLAEYLRRITGAEFETVQGDGTRGIAVGSTAEFPDVPLGELFSPQDPFRREEYILRTHEQGVYLVGATPLAAQHAVWDFLYRLGYRQYFPTESWEIVPQNQNPRVALDVFEAPDYINRMGPRLPAWGDRSYWRRWHVRNRMESDFHLSTGHAYGGILRANRAAFAEHPEYLARVDGERGGDKFCTSNPDLRQLVVDHAVRRVAKNPETDSISMDPSDGGGWCECEACRAMGSVSDRVVLLANEVARAINELGHGEKYVGMYAYNQHSPPPEVAVHPRVIVSIATAFIRGGYTVKELIEGWSERAELLGIRDYFGTHVWYRAMPRRARGGNVNYLARQLPYFYEHGARFMNACAADSWGADGLGYYLAGRLLWDVKEAGRVDEIIEDFLEACFGKAKDPMREFYHLIARDHDTVRTSDDVLARMYRQIASARKLAEEPAVRKRLDELILFTRYVERMFKFTEAGSDAARTEAAQRLFRHTYRMRDTMMAYPQALYRWLKRQGVNVPGEADPGRLTVGTQGKDTPPWKSAEPFGEDEITRFLEEGLANYEIMTMDFEPVQYSEELVPASEKLELKTVPTGDFGRGNTFRGRYRFFTWTSPEDRKLFFRVTGGLIKHYRDRGNVKFSLYSAKEATLEAVDTDDSTPPDGKTYEVVLESPYDGLHELKWSDGDDMTRVDWAEGQPMTVKSSMNERASLPDNRDLYFYVPKGTATVGGYTTSQRMRMLDGEGHPVLQSENIEDGGGYFNVPVSEGQDGTLWKLDSAYGTQMLMTVPPYLARNEQELLLPREVVEKDSAQRD